MKKIASYLSKKKIIAAIAVLAVIFGYFFIFRGNGNGKVYAQVRRASIIQQVSVIGKVKPSSLADLAFEKSGKISRVNANVGDRVSEGQVLVELDSSELNAQLLAAQANVQSAQAKLDDLKNGASAQDIAVNQTQVDNARKSLEDSRQAFINSLKDSYTKSDDSVRNKVDQLFTNPRTAPQLSFPISDHQLALNIQNQRLIVETILVAWSASVEGLDESDNLEFYYSEAQKNLEQVRKLLDQAALAVNGAIPSSTLTSATIATWKTDVATARTNVNTAISGLSSARQSYNSAVSALELAQRQLDLKKAGATADEIKSQEAVVNQAKANAQNILAQLSKNSIRSPFTGTISKQDAKLGEIAAPNKAIVSVMSEKNLEIEANVPEIEVGKISVGNPVAITMDAFPGETFYGKIAYIDQAETVSEGVVNFKIKVVFNSEDPRLKSGLTSNLKIETFKKDNVLVLPRVAVIRSSEGSFVRKMENNELKQVIVETGVQGSNGEIEIVSGLSEGDKILNSELDS